MKHAKTSRIFSLLALVLAVAMLLTLVGCGGSDKKPEKKPDTKTTVTTAPSEQNDATTPTDEVETPSQSDPSATDPSESDPSASDPSAS